MSGRLLLIEARRTPAIWLVPPLVFICFRTYGDRFTPHAPLWILTSVAIGQAATIIGPPVAGIAAWIAGRERRRGAQELLATTSCSPLSRLLTTWLATTGCGLLIYGFFAVGGGIVTARGASWGGPDPWLILAGATAIMAYCALGFAIGVALPYRFIAPLVAIGLLIAQQAVIFLNRVETTLFPLQYLSPAAYIDPTVWYGGRPNIAPFVALTYLSLLGIVWAMLSLWLVRFRDMRSWIALLLALFILLTGVIQAVAHTPTQSEARTQWYGGAELRPYTPICHAAAIEVCIHPAYQPWLGQLSVEINSLLAPLVGLSGMPQRAEQVAPDGRSTGANSSATIVPFPLDFRNLYDAKQYAVYCTLFDCTKSLTLGGLMTASETDARVAIARWLWLRVGEPSAGPYSRFCFARPGQDNPCLAAERFTVLDQATQRAWLEAHFADLRAGRVTLEELP